MMSECPLVEGVFVQNYSRSCPSSSKQKWKTILVIMEPQSDILAKTLQLINNNLSLLSISRPACITLRSVDLLFGEKIYCGMLARLYPDLRSFLSRLEKCKESTLVKFVSLIALLQNHVAKESLSHIDPKAIVNKDIKAVFSLVSVLYKSTKRRLDLPKTGPPEESSSSEGSAKSKNAENTPLTRNIAKPSLKRHPSGQENGKYQKPKKLQRPARSRQNILSTESLLISKHILKGLQKVQAKSSNKFMKEQTLKDQICRKKQELELKAKELRSLKRRQEILFQKQKQVIKANSLRRLRSDSQKQRVLKSEMESEQKSLDLKLRDQRSLYLRKVDSTLTKLEKQRSIENQRTQRDRHRDQTRLLNMQIEAISTYYRSQTNLANQVIEQDRLHRVLVDKAYKDMASKLERQLRQENKRKLKLIRMRSQQELFRPQEQGEIQKEVRELYKKYR